MATTDTPWIGLSDGKLYLTSGSFSSTLKQSEDISAISTSNRGISYDGTNTPWTESGGILHLQSGQFTSTIKVTTDVSSVDATAQDISSTGTPDTPYAGNANNKLYLLSGQFTTTVKDSEDISSVETSISGISYDGTNTPWSGSTDDKLYLQSGQFTATIKDSLDVSGVETAPSGISYDGTNTYWIGFTDDKLYKNSGQFTSTIKTSQDVSAVDGFPIGIDVNNFTGRIPSADTTGDSSLSLPLLHISNNIIQLPILVVQGGGGAGASITLPQITIQTLTVDSDITFPSLTVLGTYTAFPNDATTSLPIISVSIKSNFRGDASLSLKKITLSTVAQQGTVESIDITMPLFSLTARSGHKVALTLPELSLTGSGANGYKATYNKDLPRMTVNVKASQNNIGDFNVTLPRFSFSNRLLTGIISLSGGNRTLPIMELNAHAFRGENGDGAISLPIFTTGTDVFGNPDGTVSQNLQMLVLDAFADTYINRII